MTSLGRVVIALGGNALMTSSGESPSVSDEGTAARIAFDTISPLIPSIPNLLIAYGNGPQVGTLLLRSELSARQARLPRLPLDHLVADTAGGMGYLLVRELRNSLTHNGVKRSVVALLTQVLVQPGPTDPLKPVGPFYDEVGTTPPEPSYQYRRQPDGRFRRVVPSPTPLEILELEPIRTLFDSGVITVAGGGGVAITDSDGNFKGIEGVIDKDLTSSLLARSLDADLFIILTNIDAVRTDFNSPMEQKLDSTTTTELRLLQHKGSFREGSMAPKVEAAIAFSESAPDRRAIICHLNDVREAIDGNAGTQVL